MTRDKNMTKKEEEDNDNTTVELLETRGKLRLRLIVGSRVFLQFADGSRVRTFRIKRLSIELFPLLLRC